MESFTDLATATYCPRKLYYHRRSDGHDPPSVVRERRELTFQYSELRRSDAFLRDAPLGTSPAEVRANLDRAATRIDCWQAIVNPPARDVFLEGSETRGIAHKVLEDPLAPSIVSAGEPPSSGVWEPDSVRAVGAAKALTRERGEPVERAFVEYPSHGIIRPIDLSTRRVARFRQAVRTARSLADPPARTPETAKCAACEYRTQCGTRTRSLASRL